MLTAVSLDDAWREAEAALPVGWCDLVVWHWDATPEHSDPRWYGAKTTGNGREWVEGIGTTPTAALRDLTRKLREL